MPEARHLTLGQMGESLARAALERQGYVILAAGYKTGIGEIDIVARDGDCLVFVEVKTRRNHEKGTPAEAVTPRKQRQLIRTATDYLARVGGTDASSCRFDVVAVTIPDDLPPLIDIIQNAFDAS